MSPELERILSQAQQLDRSSQIQLISHLSNQTQLEPKEQKENPWLAIAGSLVDDPFFDDYIAEIDRYRRELNSQIVQTCSKIVFLNKTLINYGKYIVRSSIPR